VTLSNLLNLLGCACRLVDLVSPWLVKTPGLYTAPVKTLELFSYGPF